MALTLNVTHNNMGAYYLTTELLRMTLALLPFSLFKTSRFVLQCQIQWMTIYRGYGRVYGMCYVHATLEWTYVVGMSEGFRFSEQLCSQLSLNHSIVTEVSQNIFVETL